MNSWAYIRPQVDCQQTVVLLLSSHCHVVLPLQRNLWQKATAIAKTALDEKAALLQASDLTSALTCVEATMLSKGQPDMERWNALACVEDVIHLLEGKEGMTQEQASVVTQLLDAKKSLLEQATLLPPALPLLNTFLAAQWSTDQQGLSKFVFTSEDEENAASETIFFRNMTAGTPSGFVGRSHVSFKVSILYFTID